MKNEIKNFYGKPTKLRIKENKKRDKIIAIAKKKVSYKRKELK